MAASTVASDAQYFCREPEDVLFDGLLFDMDGTIIDSTDAIVKYWKRLGKVLGVDGEEILKNSHGVRSIETVALYNEKLANWDDVKMLEGRIPRDFGRDATTIPGSREMLSALSDVGATWTIVTSGSGPLVRGWLSVMKLTQPAHMVVAEDVPRGKPDPACYLLGRSRVGLTEDNALLVLEDSPAGVRSGKAAAMRVLGLATTHSIAQLVEAGADWVVEDMRAVTVVREGSTGGKTMLRISKSLDVTKWRSSRGV